MATISKDIAIVNGTEGLCKDEDPELFFPEGKGHVEATREAKGICSRCPIVEECLAVAMKNGEKYGIWGGTTAKEREYLRRRPHQVSSHITVLRLSQGRKDLVPIVDENAIF